MAYRFSDFSLPERLSPSLPPWLTQAVIALLAVGLSAVARLLVNILLPGAAPFIMMFPALLLAAVLGGRASGLMTLGLGALAAWVFVFPPAGEFMGKPDTAVPNTIVFLISGGLTVLIGGVFRTAALQGIADRQGELDGRDLLLREFQHRVKNDFQIVGSILTLQRRKAAELGAEVLLDEALDRLRGLSEVHANLWAPGGDAGEVNLEPYLNRLCAALSSSLTSGSAVQLSCKADPVVMPRDRAGAIGLIVNELVTNAIKHAFPEGLGEITVRFEAGPGGGRLTVADNGVGLPPEFNQASGVGRKLVAAVARQAGGELSWVSQDGARFQLDLAPHPV